MILDDITANKRIPVNYEPAAALILKESLPVMKESVPV